MEITYKNKRIERICNDVQVSDRTYGAEMSEKLHERLDQIRAVDSVETLIQFRIGRCHRLTGDRKGQFALDLEGYLW